MSIPYKSERSQLNHEEFEEIRVTHHPLIYDLTGKELHALKLWLREQRDKARVLARQKQREMRGKAEPRGKSFPGTVEQPLKRKQIFVAALKRVNRELDRLRKLEARTAQVEVARTALALHLEQNLCTILKRETRLASAYSLSPARAGARAFRAARLAAFPRQPRLLRRSAMQGTNSS